MKHRRRYLCLCQHRLLTGERSVRAHHLSRLWRIQSQLARDVVNAVWIGQLGFVQAQLPVLFTQVLYTQLLCLDRLAGLDG